MMRSLTLSARKASIGVLCLIAVASTVAIHEASGDPPQNSQSADDTNSFSSRLRLADARLATAAMMANYVFQQAGQAPQAAAAPKTVLDELQQLRDELKKTVDETSKTSATPAERQAALSKLQQILVRLQNLRGQLKPNQPLPPSKATDCRPCQTVTPAPDCSKNVPCKKKDACVYIYLPPLHRSEPVLSADGVYALDSIINAGIARGFENVAIRAANATKTCPDTKECETTPCPPQTPTPAAAPGQAATGGAKAAAATPAKAGSGP